MATTMIGQKSSYVIGYSHDGNWLAVA